MALTYSSQEIDNLSFDPTTNSRKVQTNVGAGAGNTNAAVTAHGFQL